MLLTSQELAVREWIVAAVADAGLEAIPLERVLWADQDFPAGVYPRCELAYTGGINLGADRPKSLGAGPDEMRTRTEGEATLAITFVTKTSDTAPSRAQAATSYMREVNLRTHSFVARGMTDAKLSIRAVNLTPTGNRVQGASEWELRAGLDITFGIAASIGEDPGIIETVEVTGTTTPPTPVRSFLIPS